MLDSDWPVVTHDPPIDTCPQQVRSTAHSSRSVPKCLV
jgi:hypothetical protein